MWFRRGAGWESRTPVLSLENLYINRYTNPAIRSAILQQNERRTEVIIAELGYKSTGKA
jgi:hypothetical protein